MKKYNAQKNKIMGMIFAKHSHEKITIEQIKHLFKVYALKQDGVLYKTPYDGRSGGWGFDQFDRIYKFMEYWVKRGYVKKTYDVQDGHRICVYKIK